MCDECKAQCRGGYVCATHWADVPRTPGACKFDGIPCLVHRDDWADGLHVVADCALGTPSQ